MREGCSSTRWCGSTHSPAHARGGFFLSLHLSNGALCRVDLHPAEALGESACVKVRDVR